jgi:hypothetical protein
METWFKRNYKTIIISAFLIPIMTVALVSISHVTKWYGLSNPFTWAIYLSIGIEIAALSALAAISADMGRKVYFPFGIVTLVQFIGNIYFAYSFIDVTSDSFKSWVELVAPFVEFMGVDATDLVGHKRFLAFFAGGMLPIISLSFLHMLVKFTQENKEKGIDAIIDDGGISEYIQAQKNKSKEEVKEEIPVVDAKDIVGEVSRVRLTEEDLAILERYLNNPPKPNDALVKAAEEYKKQQETPVEVYEKELDGFDGFDAEPILTPEVTEEVKIEETPTVTPTETTTPTLTPTVTSTQEEVTEVLEEEIPIVIPTYEPTPEEVKIEETPIETPIVETPTIEVEEIPLPTMEDAPIEVEEEYIPTPDEEEMNFQRDWDVTLMDGLEDEPPYEEPTPEPIIETPTEELPTIESEEEKKN